MESSKLTVKIVERTTLYFNKFEYRVVVKSPYIGKLNQCKTLDEFKARIGRLIKYKKTLYPFRYPGWENVSESKNESTYELDDKQCQLVNDLLPFIQTYKNSEEVTFRHEYNTIGIYTSSRDIVNTVTSFCPTAKITQAKLMPDGVITFKGEPPAKYRAFMTNCSLNEETKESMLAYFSRTPDITPNLSLSRILCYKSYWYINNSCYIDYDDDRNLLMFIMMFPGTIGKKFKLEKRPK